MANPATVISAVGTIAGVFGSSSAAKAAKRAARIEARNEKIATQDRIFQIGREERTLAGITRSRAAGAGFLANQGSVLNILAEQAREFERERQVTAKVGASKVAAALAGGAALSKQYQAQGIQNLFTGLSQVALFAKNS